MQHITERAPARKRQKLELSGSKRAAVIRKSDERCWYCGQDMRWDGTIEHPWNTTIDHVVPVSRGGTDDLENLVYCCRGCNQRKGTRTVEEFRERELMRHVRFSSEQESYLASLGLTLPPLEERGSIVFAFEEHGWA